MFMRFQGSKNFLNYKFYYNPNNVYVRKGKMLLWILGTEIKISPFMSNMKNKDVYSLKISEWIFPVYKLHSNC